jgi:branched-chain amino acid transport system ATP-binding protein
VKTASELSGAPAAGVEPLLAVRGLSKRFGGLTALDLIDLDVREGEVVGLIGPNGAGKTTFVNCITGVERPTSGQVLFAGADLLALPSYEIGRRGLARTFQVVRPFRSMTMRENVAVGALFGSGAAGRSVGDALTRADAILDMVGLGPMRFRYASDLSVADSKRLELAKALAMEPRMLVLDEAMAGLNASEVDRAVELIRQIAASGITILVIEHVLKVITALAQRIVVFHQGRKLVDGPPDEVLSDKRVIAAYLGERYAQRVTAPQPGQAPERAVEEGEADDGLGR